MDKAHGLMTVRVRNVMSFLTSKNATSKNATSTIVVPKIIVVLETGLKNTLLRSPSGLRINHVSFSCVDITTVPVQCE